MDTEEEKNYILSGQVDTDLSTQDNAITYTPDTKQLLTHKESWGVIISSAAIDPIWWFLSFGFLYIFQKFMEWMLKL